MESAVIFLVCCVVYLCREWVRSIKQAGDAECDLYERIIELEHALQDERINNNFLASRIKDQEDALLQMNYDNAIRAKRN